MNFKNKLTKTFENYFSNESNNKRKKFNEWSKDNFDSLKSNLGQVITWTEKLHKEFDFENGEYGLVFRKTNPIIEKKLYNFDNGCVTWNLDFYSGELYHQLLQQAISIREENEFNDYINIEEYGRILVFETAVSTCDGAPMSERKNFVDESDVPPIDTWFFLINSGFNPNNMTNQFLYAWVPKKFESLMQNAIDVEILDSYDWLDEIDTPLWMKLKSI